MSVFGSSHLGIERSPRRLLWDCPSCRARETSAPEFPGPIAEPARFRPQHDVGEMVSSDYGLEAPDVLERSKVHRLRKNPDARSRPQTDGLPPEKPLFKLRPQLCREGRFEIRAHLFNLLAKKAFLSHSRPGGLALLHNGVLSPPQRMRRL
jgi:hypothetical protein